MVETEKQKGGAAIPHRPGDSGVSLPRLDEHTVCLLRQHLPQSHGGNIDGRRCGPK